MMKIVNVFILNSTRKFNKILINKPARRNICMAISSSPLVFYNWKGVRDAANTKNCQKAIEKQKKLLEEGKITQQEFDSRKTKIENYYDKADDSPKEISSDKIKSKEPSFKGNGDDLNENIESNSSMELDSDTGFIGTLKKTYNNLKEQFKEKLSFKKENIQPAENSAQTITVSSETVKLSPEELEFKTELDNIDNIDVSMSPEMEEYLSQPQEEVVEGLMSDILDGLPEGFGVDDDVYDTMLSLTKEAVGFLE